jgi:hypothetical protein
MVVTKFPAKVEGANISQFEIDVPDAGAARRAQEAMLEAGPGSIEVCGNCLEHTGNIIRKGGGNIPKGDVRSTLSWLRKNSRSAATRLGSGFGGVAGKAGTAIGLAGFFSGLLSDYEYHKGLSVRAKENGVSTSEQSDHEHEEMDRQGKVWLMGMQVPFATPEIHEIDPAYMPDLSGITGEPEIVRWAGERFPVGQ